MTKPAILFDWDGVIINSEAYHKQSWFLLADEIGEKLSEAEFTASFGMRNQQIIPDVFKWAHAEDHQRIQELGDRKEALYREIMRREGITPLPGVVALLEDLKERGLATAVGSSTPLANIEAVMALTGLDPYFRVIVAAEDVTVGKPDPEVFLKGATKLMTTPEACVVIEDAHVGIKAAKSGGMKVLAVATTHPRETLQEADAVHDDLTSVDADVLTNLLRES